MLEHLQCLIDVTALPFECVTSGQKHRVNEPVLRGLEPVNVVGDLSGHHGAVLVLLVDLTLLEL